MTAPIHVLLIEDNPADALLTRETLETSKLHLSVEVAPDGEFATDLLLKRAAEEPHKLPDLILLDLNLPRVKGTEVLAEIRGHEKLRVIPVVVLTSSDAERDVARSYELGANCYVVKPVGLEAFQTIVSAVQNFWFSVVKLP